MLSADPSPLSISKLALTSTRHHQSYHPAAANLSFLPIYLLDGILSWSLASKQCDEELGVPSTHQDEGDGGVQP
jgi:hypothetical protein